MSWVPLVTFLLHVAEEFPTFPAWATRHFGATSRAWYVYSHVVLIGTLVALTWLAAGAPGSIWSLLLLAVQWTLATNAAFHLATTWRFREYSPGVVTGTVLFLPATAWTLREVFRAGTFTRGQIGFAIALGTALGAAVIGSLYLRMDVDWRLRRASRPR